MIKQTAQGENKKNRIKAQHDRWSSWMHPNVIPQHLTTIIWCAHQHIKVKNASIKMLISFSVKTGVFIKKKKGLQEGKDAP